MGSEKCLYSKDTFTLRIRQAENEWKEEEGILYYKDGLSRGCCMNMVLGKNTLVRNVRLDAAQLCCYSDDGFSAGAAAQCYNGKEWASAETSNKV